MNPDIAIVSWKQTSWQKAGCPHFATLVKQEQLIQMREKPYSSEIPLISLEVTFQIKILSKLIAETRFLQNVWYKCVSLRFPNLVSYAKNVGAKNTFLRAEPTRSLMFYREICFVRLQKLPEKVFAFYTLQWFFVLFTADRHATALLVAGILLQMCAFSLSSTVRFKFVKVF